MYKIILILFLSSFFINAESLYLLTAQNKKSKVIKSELNGKSQKDIIQNIQTSRIAINNKKIYWLEGKTLKSANKDGSKVEVIAKLNEAARSIAVDKSNLYWVVDDNSRTEVIKADLQGNNQEVIIRGKDIDCVSIDTTSKQIFWVTSTLVSQTQRVRVSDLDGKVTRTILRSSKGPFSCLSIDSKNQNVYWIQSSDNVQTIICRCDFNGQKIEKVIESSFITDVATTEDKILWIGRNAGGSAIFQLDIDDITADVEVLTALNAPIANLIVD